MIDRQTAEKIKDAANIVDVVSEFVTLRKSGANYKGLCPFHNEKTPSFYVSPARGTCHCFGCGKGGNSVTFIMEHEQMDYPEALRWLAKKYHIEIQERNLTDDERREQSERESMYIVNEWASEYFARRLREHPDGIALGMEYFRSRGFRDDVIKTFRLGYDLPDRFALAFEARKEGYKDEFLLKTGICYRTDRGELIDRYAGRVVFPWIGVNGKVVGFTARVLDSRTKGVAQKYVNSPDSDIFHKANELYGIHQAKKSITKNDRVYLVEGQADVIAMYQNGIENVVAGSGTALSFHQIHMLHRFTSNITLIYDDDEAGIHAALKGTDMLLSEGMNLKVLMLPDGDDPDSFARKHSPEEFRQYIEDNQTDFIQFKTKLLLDNQTDPLKRSEAINSVVSSIAVVQNPILRDTYIHDCSQRMGIAEATLINTMNRFIRENKEKQAPSQNTSGQPQNIASQPVLQQAEATQASKVEQMLIRLVIKHGEVVVYNDVEDDEGNLHNLSISQYIHYNLTADNLSFANPLYNKILQEAVEHNDDEGFEAEPYFVHHADIEISKAATAISMDRYLLPEKQHNRYDEYTDEDSEKLASKARRDSLRHQMTHLIMDFRMDYVEQRLKDLKRDIALSVNDTDKMLRLMEEYKDMQQIRNALAKNLGNDIIV